MQNRFDEAFVVRVRVSTSYSMLILVQDWLYRSKCLLEYTLGRLRWRCGTPRVNHNIKLSDFLVDLSKVLLSN